MALFRSGISKQRALVSRISSVALYQVHWHLQYTSASATDEQVWQKLDFCANSQLQEDKLYSTTNIKQLSSQLSKQLNSENHKNYHDSMYKRFQQGLDGRLLNNVSSVEPLVSPAQLALMSLSYDEKWCISLKNVYKGAMESKELVHHNNLSRNKAMNKSKIKHYSLPVKDVSKVYHSQEVNVNSSLPKEIKSPELLLFSDHGNEMQKEKQKMKYDDRCDPLLLAMVYQALRDELPIFFQNGHGYDLYHNRIKFINGLTNTTFSGLRAYKFVMTSMRLAAQMLMSDIRMDILKITKDNKECSIKVRWRVSGIPRYPSLMERQKTDNNCRYVDGFSIFEVDTSGLICCHRLMKLMPSQSSQTDNPLWALNTAAVISLLRQQKSFEMLARHRVEDIEVTCLPF